MNHTIKVCLSKFLEHSGLLGMLERRQAPPQIAVFAFHRVLPPAELEHSYNRNIVIEENCFRVFLEWLAREWCVVTFSEALKQAFPVSGRVCALTFDDGWEDNYRIAFPLLQQLGFPATIFLPTA